MKKIFLVIALTGIVGAASANSIATFTKGTEVTLRQDEKKKCDKEKKGCCKKDAAKKADADVKGETKEEAKGCQHGSGKETKACCKNKAAEKKVEEKKQ